MSIFAKARALTDSQFAAGRQCGLAMSAGRPMSLVSGGSGSSSPIFGEQDQARSRFEDQYSYSKRSWAYASIRPTANRIAEQPLRVARTTRVKTSRSLDRSGKHFLPEWVRDQSLALNLEPLDSHRLLTAVQNPNPFATEWHLMWCSTFSLEATGNAYWWFTESDSELYIWYVPAHWVKPTGMGKWQIGAHGDFSQPVDATFNDLCRFYVPDPSNPLASMSSLSAAGTAILTEDAIQTSQERSFRSPMPAYAFTIGERVGADGVARRPELTSTQEQEINERINRMLAGPQGRARALLLDALITNFHRLTPPNSEMDYLESGKATARKIQQIHGTNPTLMGDTENANRGTATVAEKLHLDNVVNPRLVMIGQTLTAFARRSSLISDPTIVAYYKPVVSRDPDIEQRDWAFAANRAMISDDDFRVYRLGMPRKDVGGEYARINNQFAVVKVEADPTTTPVIVAPQQLAGGQAVNGQSVGQGGGQGSDTGDSTANNPDGESEPGGSSSDQNRDIGKSFKDAKTPENVKAVSAKAWASVHKMHEDSLAAELSQVIANAGEISVADDTVVTSIAESLTASIVTACRKNLASSAASGASLQETLFKSIPGYYRKGVGDILFGLDGQVAIEIERYLDGLFSQGYWSDISGGIESELRGVLERFQKDGLSADEIARNLQSELEGISRRRGLSIATTETTGAMNAGAWAVRNELASAGAVVGSEWNSILDNRTRGMKPSDQFSHVKMDGVRVGARELFDVDGEPARFPGDYTLSAANRVNCRCFATAVSAFE